MANIERPIYNNFSSTNRSFCGSSAENRSTIPKIQNIQIISDIKDIIDDPEKSSDFVKKNFRILNHLKTQCVENCNDILLDNKYNPITDPQQLKKLMSEVLIRFDTDPSNYMQEDYFALLKVLLSLFHTTFNPTIQLYTNTPEQINIKKTEDGYTIGVKVSEDIETDQGSKIVTANQVKEFVNNNKLKWEIK